MARVRVQRKTRQREPPSVHRFALSLETRLANVVCRDVAPGPSPLDLRACAKITRRRKKNSSPVCAQPIPKCAAEIHPRGLVSVSLYQTRRARLVDAYVRWRISAASDLGPHGWKGALNLVFKESETFRIKPGRDFDPLLLVLSRGVACRCARTQKRRPELWVSCCKRSIGIVPKRKIASINGGLLSNQNYHRSRRRVSRRCGSRPQTRQRAGNRWATILTITMTSASLIKKAASLRGSAPKPN